MSIFMKYEGVSGESSDHNHKGWIDIDDLRWSVRRNITSHTSSRNDRESANAVIQDLTLTRRMDRATPDFFIDSCCGKGRTVVLHLTKTGSGSGSDIFMEYTLNGCLIRRYRVKASSQGDTRPRELLVMSFIDLGACRIQDESAAEAGQRPIFPILFVK